jgi:hypothetical protein
MNQEQWHIKLSDDTFTLQQAINGMKEFKLHQDEIPFAIQLVENPKYDVGLFAGNVDLFTHDCIHILLGRGLLLKDEAFVIGYTMGSTKKLSRIRKNLFLFCSKYLYPEGYKFTEDERLIFNLGIAAGSKCGEDLSKVDFEWLLDHKIKNIRDLLGIKLALLESCYSLEEKLYPASCESQRLLSNPKSKWQEYGYR